MNYLMLQRELKVLGEDLTQMSESLTGPEGAEPRAPRAIKPKEEVKREIDYVSAKLEAVSLLVEDKQ